MASYSEEYKIECVAHLELFNKMKAKKEVYFIDKVQINNVRELVNFLDISSYSLYNWQKIASYQGNQKEVEDKKDEIEKDLDQDYGEKNEVDLDAEDGFENYEPYVDEILDYPKGVKAENWNGDNSETKQTTEEQNGDMTFKMGTTFFQTLAQGLGIKNYRMPLNQLYLTIGNELIKLSGLAKNGVRKELRIE